MAPELQSFQGCLNLKGHMTPEPEFARLKFWVPSNGTRTTEFAGIETMSWVYCDGLYKHFTRL